MAATHEGWAALLDATDQKHSEAHKRLRDDFRQLEERVEEMYRLLNDANLANKQRIHDLANTPVDATKLIMTPKVVVSIVGTALLVSGSMWAFNTGMRSDVRDILTRMDAQRIAMESAVKFQDMQTTAIKVSVDEVRRRQEDQQQQILGLKESILSLTNQRR